MMVHQLMKGSFIKGLIAVSMAVQLAGCGGGDGGTDSSVSSAVTDSSPDSSTDSPASPAVTDSSATINWVAPVARADGSPLSLADIGGYRVYYGTTEGDYPNRIDVTDGTAVGTVLTDLPPGTYYFVVTTQDTAGRESKYSDVLIKTI